MKNLIISLSLITSSLIGQSTLAQEEVKPLIGAIETVVVVAKPETTDFEIYSIEITKNLLNATMESMRDDISTSLMNNALSLITAELE